MAVKYIDVTATSDLFAPAVRAYGDIAIIGRGGGFAVTDARPKDLSSPAGTATAFPPGATVLTAPSADTAAAGTVRVDAQVHPGTVLSIGTDDSAEVRTVTATGAGGGDFQLTLDHPLGAEHPAGTDVREVPGGDDELVRAVRIAFRQSPPPTKVWGVPVDRESPQWQTALDEVGKLDVQLVVLADTPLNTANSAVIGALAGHVAGDLGDGKERIGVAMFDRTLGAAAAVQLITGPIRSDRMVLVAHKSDEDVAAATAGVIAGYRPHISMLLKPISIAMTEAFSDSEIDVYDRHLVNWITSPVLLPGQALYLGEGYTADAGGGKKYIDIVRTLDDVDFRIKAVLIEAIGTLRISRVGLRSVATLVQSVLSPLVAQEVLEDFTIVIPLLTLLDKTDRLPSEDHQIAAARAARSVDMTVQVVYAGAIHRLKIDLVFTG
ncbi:hypothetical protein ACIGZJ_14885 [Kitasatospora sp. NPDC052868]|uniref:hypothetical protein n=1 Tax=Kitasatospora sp. NPDC052868 TaxID=3364060 RepID=UPI0037CBF5BE